MEKVLCSYLCNFIKPDGQEKKDFCMKASGEFGVCL